MSLSKVRKSIEEQTAWRMWADSVSRVMWDATERFRSVNRRKMSLDQLINESRKYAEKEAEQDDQCKELKEKWDNLRIELEQMTTK
jgi:Ni,Fe-hydrogenase III large subunit